MEKQVIAEISVAPLGTPTTSLSRYVAGCLDLLKQSPELSYELTAMGTIIQGPLEPVFEMMRQMHEVPFGMGAVRVLTSIKIDDRRDKQATMAGKVTSVQQAAAPHP